MTDMNRKIRLAIAGKVGCDERTVQAVIDGKQLRYPAVETAVKRELKRHGITVAPPAASAPAPPDASTPTAEG